MVLVPLIAIDQENGKEFIAILLFGVGLFYFKVLNATCNHSSLPVAPRMCAHEDRACFSEMLHLLGHLHNCCWHSWTLCLDQECPHSSLAITHHAATAFRLARQKARCIFHFARNGKCGLPVPGFLCKGLRWCKVCSMKRPVSHIHFAKVQMPTKTNQEIRN